MIKRPDNLTPMMVQYFDVKEQYPDCFLFYRLGDFYELFYDDALQVSELLEITLTSRNKNADDPVPMCGVPHHAAAEYIRTLVDKGYKVAICEQVEDPKLTKGMVKREVVQVVTPGTLFDKQSNDDKQPQYLAAVIQQAGCYHLAYCDVTTGELRATTVDTRDVCCQEIRLLAMKEVVVTPEADAQLVEQLAALGIAISKQKMEPLADEMTALVTAVSSEGQRAVVALLLAYVQATQLRQLTHLQAVDSYQVDHFLVLDQYAQTNLELTASIRAQQKKGSLLWLLDETKTAMGGRMLRQWLEKPLLNLQQISQRHEQVESLMHHYFERVDLITSLKRVYDLERLVGKISFGHANARDLVQLKQSLQQVPTLRALVNLLAPQSIWSETLERLDPIEDVVTLIQQAIQDEPPLQTRDGGVIKAGFNAQLDQYREVMTNGKQWIADLQLFERERTGIKTLKIGYNRVFGYYIEVTKSQLAHVPDGLYERKQTLANAERFVTPELKERERLILEAEEKSSQLEYELFVNVRDNVKSYRQRLQQLAKTVAALDVLQAFATVSEKYHYVKPTFVDNHEELTIVNGRHPVVERVIGTENYVANDLQMTAEQTIILITGPNMSGKSTFMRQVALTVIMAQMGCFVPCDQARLPIFDRIFTRIGAADDLIAGQSTFMVEMMETNQALQYATARSLLLFDEIGRGTATYDGMALAEAILRYVHNRVHAKALFSTHYHELTVLEESLPQLHNMHVGAVEQHGQLIFLHQLLHGPADKSYGLHVAQLAGLPKALIQDAQQVLSRLESQRPTTQTQQLSLFTAESLSPNEQHVIEAIQQLNLNTMTPLALMQKVADWQQLLDD